MQEKKKSPRKKMNFYVPHQHRLFLTWIRVWIFNTDGFTHVKFVSFRFFSQKIKFFLHFWCHTSAFDRWSDFSFLDNFLDFSSQKSQKMKKKKSRFLDILKFLWLCSLICRSSSTIGWDDVVHSFQGIRGNRPYSF